MHSVIKRTLIAIIFAIPTLAFATPITFNFTGTVSDYILSNGQLQKTSSAIPKWNGKSVSGSVTMDLDNAVQNTSIPSKPIMKRPHTTLMKNNGCHLLSIIQTELHTIFPLLLTLYRQWT